MNRYARSWQRRMGRGMVVVAFTFLGWLLGGASARAEAYLEGYAGYVKSATVFRDYLVMTTHHPALGTFEEHHTRGTFRPHVIAGLKVGTWLGPDGFLGAASPSRLQYFGVYLDLSYHRHNMRYRVGPTIFNGGPTTGRHAYDSDGKTISLALMFAGRLGFFPTDQVPFGRLQPYLGLGPALIITEQRPTLRGLTLTGGVQVPYTLTPGAETDVVPALAIEPGVRWLFNKNFSLDLSFKFRWAHPSFTFRYTDPFGSSPETFTLNPQYLILSFQLGAAYHF